MSKCISYYPDRIKVSLELPWELAEALVKTGPALIEAVKGELTKAKAIAEAKSPISRFERRQYEDEAKRWQLLAIQADREIRKLRVQEGLSDRQGISCVAKKYRVSHPQLQMLLAQYRKECRRRLQERLTVRIVRLYFQGLSNAEIAASFRPKLSTRTVQRTLKECGDLVAFIRGHKGNTLPAAPEKKVAAPSTPKSLPKQPPAFANYEERKEAYFKLATQLYRQYRNLAPNSSSERRTALVKLATCHGINIETVETLLSFRRRKVEKYLQKRRMAAVYNGYWQGFTNKQIAARVGLHDRTVALYLQQGKKDGSLKQKRCPQSGGKRHA